MKAAQIFHVKERNFHDKSGALVHVTCAFAFKQPALI